MILSEPERGSGKDSTRRENLGIKHNAPTGLAGEAVEGAGHRYERKNNIKSLKNVENLES